MCELCRKEFFEGEAYYRGDEFDKRICIKCFSGLYYVWHGKKREGEG